MELADKIIVTNMIKFLIFCNKAGKLRFIKPFDKSEKKNEHADYKRVIQICLKRTNKQCTFFTYGENTVVYRLYGSLYFIALTDQSENELAVIEFLHNLVETLDVYFQNVCELDVMYHLERVHMIVDEMIQNGCIVESSKAKILAPIHAMDQANS